MSVTNKRYYIIVIAAGLIGKIFEKTYLEVARDAEQGIEIPCYSQKIMHSMIVKLVGSQLIAEGKVSSLRPPGGFASAMYSTERLHSQTPLLIYLFFIFQGDLE